VSSFNSNNIGATYADTLANSIISGLDNVNTNIIPTNGSDSNANNVQYAQSQADAAQADLDVANSYLSLAQDKADAANFAKTKLI